MPTVAVTGPDFTIEILGFGVGLIVVVTGFDGFGVVLGSPPPLTEAVFIAGEFAALTACTVKMMFELAFTIMDALLVHVTNCPLALQLHTLPVLLEPTKAIPVGRLSVTVIVPLVPAVQLLLTVRV